MNLNQVTMPTVKMEESIGFYENLGLILIVDSRPRYARFVCPDGDSTFSLHHVEEIAVGEKPVVYFEVDDLQKRCEELQKRGIKVLDGPVMQRWLWEEANLEDPDGNKIILFKAGENRKDPPWRV